MMDKNSGNIITGSSVVLSDLILRLTKIDNLIPDILEKLFAKFLYILKVIKIE